MINLHQPIANFYDTHLRHNPIPGYVAFLNEFKFGRSSSGSHGYYHQLYEKYYKCGRGFNNDKT
jgi:hypothetical protein